MVTSVSEREAFVHEVGHSCDACRSIRRECPHLAQGGIARLIGETLTPEAEVVNADAELATKRAKRNDARKRANAYTRLAQAIQGTRTRSRKAA